jgi:hypothetical protein
MRLKTIGEYVVDEETRQRAGDSEYFTGYNSHGQQVTVKINLASVTAHVMRSRLGGSIHVGPRLSHLLKAMKDVKDANARTS